MQERGKLGEIFQGVTPKPFRDYLVRLFRETREQYPKLYVPCAGRFTAAELAAYAGYDRANMVCSDISLFSSLLGYAIAGRPLSELGIEFHDDFLDSELTPLLQTERAAGAICYALRWCQFGEGKYYEGLIKDQFVTERETHIDKFQADVDAMAERLAGAQYQVADMWDDIEAYRDDPEAVLFINPPGYAKGYTKMFDTGGRVKWRAPGAVEFDPRTDHRRMYEMVMDRPALVVMYRYQAIEPDMVDHAVFASEYTAERADYILVNRARECPIGFNRRKELQICPSKYPLLPEGHEITEASRIDFVETKKQHALYYRDLFAHKLGVARSEGYFLALIDGYVFSVFGMMFGHVLRGVSDMVNESFGFSVPNERYRRLNKLLMMCLVSGSAQKFFRQCNKLEMSPYPINRFQTTCLSDVPELKINRGILKIVGRERMPNGTYKINYNADFNDKDFSDVLATWLKRDGGVRRKRNG